MKTIVWQTESAELYQSFDQNALVNHARGGDVYEYHAANYLAQSYNVVFDNCAIRQADTGSYSYWKQLKSSKIRGDVCIKSPSVIVHGNINKHALNIGIIHHIYFTVKESTIKGRLSLKLLKYKLRKLDIVVVCSRFWLNYLKGIGCRNVRLIYNAFNPEEFNISEYEVAQFLAKNKIPVDKPIVYIGFSNPSKGVVETYNSLKNTQYTLVMTGRKSDAFNLPVRHFCLDRKDYLKLLTASDLVIAMSKIEEGWSRVAHEALLCRTPVIGSGTGGMKELLTAAGQKICPCFENLSTMAADIMVRKDEYGKKGYEFAKDFTLKKFEQEWMTLLDRALIE